MPIFFNIKIRNSFSVPKLIYNCKFFMIFILINFMVHLSVSAQGELPFDPRDCNLNCTANDVNITGAQLFTDLAGTIPLVGTCTQGENINAYIGITYVNNSNANRGVIALAADIYLNGVFANELKFCPSLILAGNQTKVFIIPIAITWVCGQSIELRNIFGGWATGGSLTTCPTVCNGIIASKCSDTISNITVLTPPTALFSFKCASSPSIQTLIFTNNSTGGASTSLTYSWDFGDGSPAVTTANPTHNFNGDGPFNVTLTATNSVGSDKEIISVAPVNCNVQPISLVSFEAIKSKKNIELKWKTTNAEQFSHFEVEKSASAQSFKNIGKVLGLSNSKETQVHSFKDELVLGMNYYRLKMVDLDGKFEYSKIISVQNAESPIEIGLLYPNPCIGYAKVNITTKEPGFWTYKIFDKMGKLIHVQTQMLQLNENTIELIHLNQGVNFIQFSEGVFSEIRRVVKL